MNRRTDHPLLEVCAGTIADVRAAIAGGADRIELCAALEVGGLTPSAGLVARARAACAEAGVALFAMVRPRSGDFEYDADELAIAIAEGEALVAQGVDGLVFGATRKGVVDTGVAHAWIEAVRIAAGTRLPCTFHRAVDVTDDPVATVDAVAGLGFDTILTSGGQRSAPAGAATIRAMVERGRASGVTVMAGAGVTPDTISGLVSETGVRAVHASASLAGPAPEDTLVKLGFATAARRMTDRAIVAALRSALDNSSTLAQ